MKVQSEVIPEYLQKVLKDAPEYLLNIVTQVMRALLDFASRPCPVYDIVLRIHSNVEQY